MIEEVQEAILELRHHYGELEVTELADGGAIVVIRNVGYGDQYIPSSGWIGFVIGFQYPRADVYPHFVTAELKRADGEPLGEAFQYISDWQGKPVVQISRRSNRLNPFIDTASTKLAKVLFWMKSR